MTETTLQQIRDRHQIIRFFDGYAIKRMEELDERKLKRPLVKSQLLEILDGDEARTPQGLQAIFGRRQVRLDPLEGSLFLVADEQMGEIGFLERLRPRIVTLYSTMKSVDLDRWIRHLILRSPELDHVWLSGLTFGVLWELVARLSRPHRFTRLVFTHDSIFDIDGASSELEEGEEETFQDSGEEELEQVIERRATSFRLIDRVGVIQEKLEALQKLYSPLYAISQMRFPSPVGRGGHDFYDNGRVTNRSESFRDHRSHLLFVVRIYEQLLKSTEEQAWYSIQESVAVPGQFRKIVGAPVVIRFQEPLTPSVFDYWIAATFKRKRNRFRLWGHPIRLGPTKVHVYGVDRHLWQPLFLELTAKGCTAIIPNGTCGNTVHRLVTNIQRYLDPGAEAFIGDKPYKQMVEESTQGIPYDLDTE
ncbi:MAG: hypothetical protein FJY85_04890 [Deltaproteobacteria bacterium]|nr:hypothetical protein [Deltaproteobacteria bacterium]